MLLLICTCNKNVINIYNYSWKALKQNLHEMLKDSWSWTHSERKSGVAKKPFMCINYYILPQALFQGTWAGSKIPSCTRQLSSFSTNSLQAYSTEGDLQERGVALASTVIFAWYPFSAPNPPWKTDRFMSLENSLYRCGCHLINSLPIQTYVAKPIPAQQSQSRSDNH